MSLSHDIRYDVEFIAGLGAVDLNTAAVNSDFVCMRDYDEVIFLIQFGAVDNSAAGTITVMQATSDGGTTKAMTTANATTIDGDEDDTLVELHVRASDLDVANSYDWVRVECTDPAQSCLAGIVIAGCRARYRGATMPNFTS